MDKLIITAALTGAATVPTQSKFIPITPQEIAADAVACAEAGAAVVHIHARNPENGMPSGDMAVFGEILQRIKAESNVVVCTTTGGGFSMTPEQRVRVVPTWKPELATCNMGSINFGLYQAARHYQSTDYRFDWEEAYLKDSENYIFANTFKGIRTYLEFMKAAGTRPEFELYDVGHIYNMAHLIETGVIATPIWMQFVLGVLGGIQATVADLVTMVTTADRVIGRENYNWSVIGVGYPKEFELATTAMFMGGHVRVGLEDNLLVKRRTPATNRQLVERMRRIAEEFERDIATPDEVRQFLNLKGLANVGY
ncbi:MAG: 3-keto-5-aminohexanoate cleavage protein [Anaerolineaceae bacterium]|nr:3-keto-5-aminohexanoate cleavage protein [Anaerolineaceae bacterium]